MIENWRDNQEIRLFRDSLRKFLEKEAIPYFNEWEEQRMIWDFCRERCLMDDSSDICCIS